MNVEILEKDDNHIKFIVRETNPVFMNTLRRTMMSECPCLAIEDVIVVENSSAIFDEVIVHRLGLIPLKTDLNSYVLPSECECEGTGCPSCSVTLTLEKTGDEDLVTVHSGDLKSTDPEVVPATDKIPIAKLAQGQSIVLEASARLGLGKDHAKWQSCVVGYKYLPIIEVDLEKCTECGDCVEECPRKIFKLGKNKLIITDPINCSLCLLCVEKCDFDAIKVRGDNSSIIITVETKGGLLPETIVETSALVIKDKFTTFIEEIKSIETEEEIAEP